MLLALILKRLLSKVSIDVEMCLTSVLLKCHQEAVTIVQTLFTYL